MEHVAMLLAMECNFAQGYLFGKPAEPADLVDMIRAGTRCIAA
jgi:EAL domain-containing protein (putative c-di-GMP-specific phosphodiesterase class I)